MAGKRRPRRSTAAGPSTDSLLDQARALCQEKKYSEALEALDSVLRQEPDNPAALFCRGRACCGADAYAAGIEALSRFLDLQPGHAEAHYWRGLCHYGSGALEAARADFDAALEQGYRQPDVYLFRGNIHHRRGEHGQAVSDYGSAIALGEGRASVYFNRGISLVSLERYGEAMSDFDEALDRGLQRADLFVWRGHCLRFLGQPERAVPEYEEAVRRAPQAAYYPLLCGQTLHELGRDEEALAPIEQAIRLGHDNAEAHESRGEVLYALGRFREAADAFGQALAVEPDNGRYHFKRGRALSLEDREEEALADFDAALQLGYPNAEVQHQRGRCLYGLKRYEEALDALALALQGGAQGPGPHLYRGFALVQLGLDEEALDAYEEAGRLGENALTLHHARATCFHHLGLPQEAIEEHTAALALRPDKAIDWATRGVAWAELGEQEKALADYGKALELDPRWIAGYVRRSQLWQGQGRDDLALADLDAAVRQGPENPVGYRWRADYWLEKEDFARACADCSAAIRLAPDEPYLYRARAWAYDQLGREEEADADDREPGRLESAAQGQPEGLLIYDAVHEHFRDAPRDQLTLTERFFPWRVAADLQQALEALDLGDLRVRHFWAVQCGGEPASHFLQLYEHDRWRPARPGPPQVSEIDIGAAEPVRCLRSGVWLLQAGGVPLAVLLNPVHCFLRFQVAAPRSEAGTAAALAFFRRLEQAVERGLCYRGKVLSLEVQESYTGRAVGLAVHRLRRVPADQVILPRDTLEVLRRNVVGFVQQRQRLAALGLSPRKGLLFYGPPGTGKTHTIHHLIQSLPGHTTLLVTAEQVGLLSEYMTLARLYQPSLVILEDVDLIGRERSTLRGGEEALLNRLLNEMDGLQPDAEVLFFLTSNRPEALEPALAARPGRIDQAIAFPLPDEDGRSRLVRLYSAGLAVPEEVERNIVKRTPGVSAAFIKELMRRAAQFALEGGRSEAIDVRDVDQAIHEMLVAGGTLNRQLLGAGKAPAPWA